MAKKSSDNESEFAQWLAKGVSDLGIKYQIGPVSSTSVINNTMPLDTRTPSESGMVSSPSRFESYQIFSTAARRVIILKGEKTMRATNTGNCSTDILRKIVRKRRPEVRTGFQSTTNRPRRFNAKANAPSSAQYRRSSKPPVA